MVSKASPFGRMKQIAFLKVSSESLIHGYLWLPASLPC